MAMELILNNKNYVSSSCVFDSFLKNSTFEPLCVLSYLVSQSRYSIYVNSTAHGQVNYENGLCLIYIRDGNRNLSLQRNADVKDCVIITDRH
jgi:hypothetical protein